MHKEIKLMNKLIVCSKELLYIGLFNSLCFKNKRTFLNLIKMRWNGYNKKILILNILINQ
jgi:hypothetical protein